MKERRPRKDHYVAHFAKFGYAAKGVTYLLLAYMVWHAADTDDRPATTQRAMLALDDGSIPSKIILLAIAAGLGGYALWKIYNAIRNPEGDKWTKRIGAVFIAGVNSALAVQAFMLAAVYRRHVSGGDQAAHWSALVMRYPLGVWAVGIAGVCICGYGLRQIYRGATADLDDRILFHHIDHKPRRWAIIVSRIGLCARGFVFGLIGSFLARAALRADPTQARDFGDSIQELETRPFGHWLLLAVAFGLFSYAIYEFIRARYRVISTR
jgi:hypothetical protein